VAWWPVVAKPCVAVAFYRVFKKQVSFKSSWFRQQLATDDVFCDE